MKNKILLLGLFVFGCMLMLPIGVKASSNPNYDSTKNIFYANGNSIIIDEKDGNTVVTWNDGSSSQIVNEQTTIVGGGIAGTNFESSNITMKGGTVYSIIGGGDGSPTESANVGTSNITITGGTVKPFQTLNAQNKATYTGGSVIGGGRLASETKMVNINITGGTIFSLVGGGLSSTKYNGVQTDAGNKINPEDSKNRVGTAIINISGGTVIDSRQGYGLFYGGGQGYSYTKKTTINVSKDADLSEAWLVGGGSNGRTDDATINVNGGKIKVIQTINRGSMINAKVNFKSGTVDKFYVGGEDPETFDNDIVNGGFLGNIVIDITGGTVKELIPGSDYNESIKANAENVMIFYKKDSVLNNSTITTKFGNSAKEYMVEDGINYISDETTKDINLDNNLFEALINSKNVYTVTIDKTTTAYSWIFDGNSITNPTIAVNTEIALSDKAPDSLKDKLGEKTKGLENLMYLNFKHHGNLPGKAVIVYYVGDNYQDGTKLYIRHFNEDKNILEDPMEVVVEDGTITFEISSCSSYVLTTTKNNSSTIKNPETGDNILFFVGILIIGVFGISLTTKKLIKN